MQAALYGGAVVPHDHASSTFYTWETGPGEPRKWPRVTQLVEADLALEARPV